MPVKDEVRKENKGSSSYSRQRNLPGTYKVSEDKEEKSGQRLYMVPCYVLEGHFIFLMLHSVYLLANLLHFLKTPIL